MIVRLGVNIDHVATVRQARRGREPDPVLAAGLALLGGADGITVHLREDRRHIQDRDLAILRQTLPTGLNLEMACADEMVTIALATVPDQVTLVPEKRQELTTEGGLDVAGNREAVGRAVERLKAAGIETALFIDPVPEQVAASAHLGVGAVEFHTGAYADARGRPAIAHQLELLERSAATALECGLRVHMGHGLNYLNVQPIVRIPGVEELNIGHSIVSRAIYVGLERAVREMKWAMQEHYPNRTRTLTKSI